MKNQTHAQLMTSSRKDEDETAADKLKNNVQRSEPPKVYEYIRQYKTFCSNSSKIMTENYGNNVLALFPCLSGEALGIVHGVVEDFEKNNLSP